MSEIHKIFKGTASNSNVGVEIEFYHLYKNGQLTWLVDSKSKFPNIGKLYSASTTMGKAFIILVNLIWMFRLQRLVFKKFKVKCDVDSKYYEIHSANLQNKTIFTGTVGDNRKAVVYGEGEAGKIFFKIPIGNGSYELVQREMHSLEHVSSFQLQSIVYPSLVDGYNLLSLSDVSNSECKPYEVVDDKAIALGAELYKKSKSSILFSELAEKRSLNMALLDDICILERMSNQKLKTNLIDVLSSCKSMFKDLSGTKIDCVFSHGDFTPWNCFHTENELIVIDWELSGDYPLYFDVIHHAVTTNTLIGKPNFDDVLMALEYVRKKLKSNVQLNESIGRFHYYVRLYAFFNALYYSHKFMLQDLDIHIQAYALINTWNRLLKYE